MVEIIRETNFHLPGQTEEVYHGKVGDVYQIEHGAGPLLAVVRTDRISAFNAKIPEPIPFKGQVLNQMSAALLQATADVAPNWFVAEPDPNVTVGRMTSPVLIELIMRGYLLGSAWGKYSEEGMRQLCDHTLPEGMHEFQPFEEPLFTPTAKTDTDPNITYHEIIEQGLATPVEYDRLVEIATALFARGQAMARERGLVLADTKYEVGRLATGELIVIDEVHTPDSSRYYPMDQFEAYLSGETTHRPDQLSKEFVREWLKAHGFTNQPGEVLPALPEQFIAEVTDRYIDLYEQMIGREFRPAYSLNPAARAEDNLRNYLESLAA